MNSIQNRLLPITADFTVLHDITYYISENQKYHKKSMILQEIQRFLKPLCIENPWMRLWGVINMLFITVNLIKIPIETCFNINFYAGNEKFHVFSIIFSIFDILLTFNTQFLHKGCIYRDHYKIAKNYIKTSFLYDFIGFFAIVMSRNAYWALLYCSKLVNYRKNIQNIVQVFNGNRKFPYFFDSFIWIFQFFIITHFLACFLFLWQGDEESVIQQLYIGGESIAQQYLIALYVINSNINIFGGVISVFPKNSSEIIMFYMINVIALWFIVYLYQMIFVKTYQKELITIDRFMSKRCISTDLQRKINNYLEYFYEKERKMLDHNGILNKMSDNLKNQLLIEAYLPIINSIPFFSKNFSSKTLNTLASKVNERIFRPGEIILEENFIYKHFYYILKGEIDLFFSYEAPIKRLMKNETFGEFSFFNQSLEQLNAKSVHNSTVLLISYEDFLKVIREDPLDYEVYCKIKDEILLYGDLENLYKSCYFCKKTQHLLTKCPLIHYFPTQEKIINTSYFKDKLTRHMFYRKYDKSKKQNALKSFKKIAENAQRYQSNNSLELNTNTSRKKSLSTSAPPIQRGRKRNIEEKKESIFFNNVNDDANTVNNTSTSSYTQKKHTFDGNFNNFMPNGPFASSDTVSVRVATDSLSHKIFSIINENRLMYHNLFTDKSISSELPIFEHSKELGCSKSSDLKNIDMNKLTKKTKFLDTPCLDKPAISSFSFEEVKIWPQYFPFNNVINIVKEINTKAKKKKLSFVMKKKEEIISNKSKISSNNSKINKKNNSSRESLISKFDGKKKTLRKSKTDVQASRNFKNKSIFDKVKTFFGS